MKKRLDNLIDALGDRPCRIEAERIVEIGGKPLLAPSMTFLALSAVAMAFVPGN